MSVTEIVESKGYKNFMRYVYGWGASVVLIGALFKIQHYPGASVMLVLGLGVEALIFFFSAFEPLHEELDWTLVYPELAGLTDDFEEDETQVRKFDRARETAQPQIIGVPIGGAVAGAGINVEGGANQSFAPGTVFVGGGGGGSAALAKFDELLEKADIGPEIFEKLGEGLKNLNKTAESLNDLGNAGSVSKEFIGKMKTATETVGNFSETYSKSTEVLKESVSTLSESYIKSANVFNETNNQLADSYSGFANKLTNEISTIGNEGAAYAEKLGILNNNLSALNSVYELQMKNMEQQVEVAKEYSKGMGNVVENISQAVENTQKMNKGVQLLEQNISSLNSIYGNMLSSLNFNK